MKTTLRPNAAEAIRGPLQRDASARSGALPKSPRSATGSGAVQCFAHVSHSHGLRLFVTICKGRSWARRIKAGSAAGRAPEGAPPSPQMRCNGWTLCRAGWCLSPIRRDSRAEV